MGPHELSAAINEAYAALAFNIASLALGAIVIAGLLVWGALAVAGL